VTNKTYDPKPTSTSVVHSPDPLWLADNTACTSITYVEHLWRRAHPTIRCLLARSVPPHKHFPSSAVFQLTSCCLKRCFLWVWSPPGLATTANTLCAGLVGRFPSSAVFQQASRSRLLAI